MNVILKKISKNDVYHANYGNNFLVGLGKFSPEGKLGIIGNKSTFHKDKVSAVLIHNDILIKELKLTRPRDFECYSEGFFLINDFDGDKEDYKKTDSYIKLYDIKGNILVNLYHHVPPQYFKFHPAQSILIAVIDERKSKRIITLEIYNIKNSDVKKSLTIDFSVKNSIINESGMLILIPDDHYEMTEYSLLIDEILI